MLGNIKVYKKPKGVRFGGSDYAIYTYYDDKVKLADSIFCGGGSGETCMVYSGHGITCTPGKSATRAGAARLREVHLRQKGAAHMVRRPGMPSFC